MTTKRSAAFPMFRAWLAALCLALVLPLLAHAQGKDGSKILKAFKDVVTPATASTAEVRCDGKQVALGTVVGADGYILTKASELKGKIVCKLKDGKDFEAKIVGILEKHDLAVLKVEAKGLPVADWAESKQAPVGNWVASVGTGELPVAVGFVSVATREVPSNLRGLPLRAGSGGYLGVAIDPEQTGAKITQVMPKRAAEKDGLKVNDVVIKVSGKPIAKMESFLTTLQGHKAGEVVKLCVKRGDKEMDVEATLGKRPAGRSDFRTAWAAAERSPRRFFQHPAARHGAACPRLRRPARGLDGKVIGVNIARADEPNLRDSLEIVRPLLRT